MATVETTQSNVALMIDLETLALGSDAFITQFGMCVADFRTREYLVPPVNYWMSDANQEDRRIDFNTVRWWMGQDPKVAKGVFETPEGTKRVSPRELFHIVEAAVKAHPGCTVWGSPAMFDLPLLSSLWKGKPWKYNFERDMMTLYKILDRDGKLQPPKNDMAHDAAADAAWQMEYLFNLMDRVAGLEDCEFRMAGLEK